jgi:hypothetical protein
MAKGNIQVKLDDVRVSYPHIFEPQSFEEDGSKPRYTATFLIPKDTDAGKATYARIMAAMVAAAKAEWGDKLPKLTPDRKCLRDGDDMEIVKESDAAVYNGHWYLVAARREDQGRPTIVDRDRRPLTAADGRPYAGCFVNGIASIWAQDHKKYGKRLNATLEGVQYFRKGDAFGMRPLATSAFDEFPDTGEDDDFGHTPPAQANGYAGADAEI